MNLLNKLLVDKSIAMKIRCLKCNDIIESKDLHDCISCICGACSIDGGNQYTRIGGDFEYINCINEDGTEEPLIKDNTKIMNAEKQ